MENIHIYGIQQIGIGVDDVSYALRWYAQHIGTDVPVFDDDNVATYMAPYMGGKPHKKRAILAVNLNGGSGYELWQYLDRTPSFPEQSLNLGDLGIFISKVKSVNIQNSYKRLKDKHAEIISDILTCPDGTKCFYLKDPWGNILQIQESFDWFSRKGVDTGGSFGCVIGVSDIDNSKKLYSDILGYDKVIFDQTGSFDDLASLPNGKGQFRRVLLTHSKKRSGSFSKLFGDSQLELIQSLDNYTPKKIFEGRYWGDMGFIHLCFDIRNISGLMQKCADAGFPFRVRSSEAFDMGEANGGWGYLEDPDGTLIEFVETHKVPIFKKIKIDLTKRAPNAPLPAWLIKAMSFKRVKFK